MIWVCRVRYILSWDRSKMNFQDFDAMVRQRRAIRHFREDPVPDELIRRLLDCTRWAPSGYNLQPTHFVVVRDEAIKQRLYTVCMNQRQLLEAPVVVVFTGDRWVQENNFER